MKLNESKHDDLIHLKFKLLETLIKHCYIDHLTGTFNCKTCKTAVHIDWHRNLAFCEMHIFSPIGMINIDDLYKNLINSFLRD